MYMTLCFFLSAFRILSLTFAILIIRLGVGLLGFISFGILYASCTWISVSFFRFGNFSAIISSNAFLIPFSLSSPFDTNVGTFDVTPEILHVALVFVCLLCFVFCHSIVLTE